MKPSYTIPESIIDIVQSNVNEAYATKLLAAPSLYDAVTEAYGWIMDNAPKHIKQNIANAIAKHNGVTL